MYRDTFAPLFWVICWRLPGSAAPLHPELWGMGSVGEVLTPGVAPLYAHAVPLGLLTPGRGGPGAPGQPPAACSCLHLHPCRVSHPDTAVPHPSTPHPALKLPVRPFGPHGDRVSAAIVEMV